MATKKKPESGYESIKLPKNTVNLLRKIKDVTGISISRFAEIAIEYKALGLPQDVKDEIKILKFLK